MPMNEFNPYSPEDIIAGNLRELDAREELLWEMRMTHLRELAEQIVRDIGQDTAFAHILSEHRPPRHTVSPQRRLLASPVFESIRAERHSTADCVYLCRELCDRLQTLSDLEPEHFLEEAEALLPEAVGVIAYQRSSYTDDAYLRFAKLIHAPRARYAHSFSALCEDVYNGFCEYCILPLESTSEGQLTGFSRLIDRYELKIAATCDIPANDGHRSTRFALLRRDAVPLTPKQEALDRFLEFSAPIHSGAEPSELLAAAALCGLALHRLDCRTPTEDERPERNMHYLFCINKGDLLAYLLYLCMEAPEHTLTGIYFHLN